MSAFKNFQKLTLCDGDLDTSRVVPDGLLYTRLGELKEGGCCADSAGVVIELKDPALVRMGGAIQ